jgi:hypothetical protein
MKTIRLIAIFLLTCVLQLQAQEDFGEPKLIPRCFLAMNLIPSTTGDLYHFAVVHYIGKEIKKDPTTDKPYETNKFEYEQIGRLEFIEIALGRMASEANPNHENMFKTFGVDTLNEFWDPIANLWRLRFSGLPGDPDDYSGWFMPNPEYLWTEIELKRVPGLPARRDSMKVIYNNQQAMLAKFGIRRFSEYLYGENLFGLFKAMQDVKWIEAYVQAPLPDDVTMPLVKRQEAPLTEAQQKAMRKPGYQSRSDVRNLTISKVSTNAWDQLTNGPNGGAKKAP